MNIEKTILDYDFNGVSKNIYEKYGYDEIIKVIISMLKKSVDEKNNDCYSFVLTFAMDSYIFSNFGKREKKYFKKLLYKNDFFTIVCENLYNDYFIIKHNTITRIGKFSITENRKFLEEAYIKLYHSNDPILSSACLFEIRWLKSKKYAKFIKQLEKDFCFIDVITLGLHYSDIQYYENRLKKLLQKCKKTFPQVFININYKTFSDILMTIDSFIGNFMYYNNISHLNKEDYERIIKYLILNYFEIYANKKIDYIELFKKIV